MEDNLKLQETPAVEDEIESQLYDQDAEDALLSTIIIEPDRLADIKDYGLESGDFYSNKNQLIYRAIKILEYKEIPIEYVTIADQLEKTGNLYDIGGPGYIVRLINTGTNGFNTCEYARIIKEKSRKRLALQLASKVAKLASSRTFDEDLVLAISELTDLVNPSIKARIRSQDSWTVAELLDATFPDPKWSIPDLIPEGLTIIGGRPKVGKSWLLLQAAIAVSSGGMFFGKRVVQGNVLFVAFEDSPRRLQDRIKKMGMPREAWVRFERKWKPMQDGGIDDLVAELAATDYRLVIFDTLTRSFPGLSQKDHPEIISQCIDEIQSIAINRNLSIVFSDHTRKPNGFNGDPVDDILYSTDKVKSADVVMALYKEQGKAGAKLLGRGRDIDEVDLALYWDPETWCWQCKGTGDEVELTERMSEVLDAVQSFKRARMIDIAKATGINKGTVYKTLEKLWLKRQIHKEEIGSEIYYEVLQPDKP